MSRPGLIPPATDHEQHDALLVAQFAAGDALDEQRQQQAQLLTSGCAACAELAQDLGAVSRAVAWEPVPPRRRDFRISPEQAEELHGNALTRFARRLALPRSRSFAPVAAGVMSIGLAFIVAGTVLPDAEMQLNSAEPASVPAPAIEEPEAPLAGLDDPGAPAADVEALFSGAIEQDGWSSESDAFAEQSDLAGAAAAPDGAAAADEAATEANTRKAGAAGSSLRAEEAEGASLGELSEAPNAEAAESRRLSEVQSKSVVELAPDPALDEVVPEAVDVTTTVGEDDGIAAHDQAATADDGVGIETLLIALGTALAIGGAVLLLLAWWARRSADPLLP